MRGQVVAADPFRCRLWEMHDRLEDHICHESCKEEIASFMKHGQLLPALARSVEGDPDCDYEVIYGARRLFVARHLNRPIALEVRELSDRQAISAMDIENRQRRDISPYERGKAYLRWLSAGHFQSQEELAAFLKISPSLVSRLIKLARMPSVIVSAFGNPLVVCEVWGQELFKALEDPQRRQATVNRARVIAAGPRPEPREVYRQLMAASARGRRRVRSRYGDEVVKDGSGRPLFRIQVRRTAVAFMLPAHVMSDPIRERISFDIQRILRESTLFQQESGSTDSEFSGNLPGDVSASAVSRLADRAKMTDGSAP